ncbi:MAG: hypothetical protein R2713_10205 [Ilumatobacteraceae bacterium]
MMSFRRCGVERFTRTLTSGDADDTWAQAERHRHPQVVAVVQVDAHRLEVERVVLGGGRVGALGAALELHDRGGGDRFGPRTCATSAQHVAHAGDRDHHADQLDRALLLLAVLAGLVVLLLAHL